VQARPLLTWQVDVLMNAKKKLSKLCDDLENRLNAMSDRLDVWSANHEIEMGNIIGIDKLNAIRGSKVFTLEMLEHPDSKHRLVALDILTSHWKVEAIEECTAKLLKMAETDPDIEVRAASLRAMGECFHGSADRHTGIYFASIVQNNAFPMSLRYSAYYGLLLLESKSLVTLACFPNNVDYEYINGFLRETKEIVSK
jgi:hypothetical protein